MLTERMEDVLPYFRLSFEESKGTCTLLGLKSEVVMKMLRTEDVIQPKEIANFSCCPLRERCS
jgi:hypothetical protein